VKIDSRNFGEIEFEEEDIVVFEDGLLAFEEYKRYIIIDNPDETIPFKWLQSLDDSNLTFVIINPFVFKKNYEFDIPEKITEKLKIKEQKDVLVYTLVVVPEDITKMTSNLLGPIIINIKDKLGKQIIIENKKYTTKHLILEELQNSSQEG